MFFGTSVVAISKQKAVFIFKIVLHKNHPKFTCSPFTLQK